MEVHALRHPRLVPLVLVVPPTLSVAGQPVQRCRAGVLTPLVYKV